MIMRFSVLSAASILLAGALALVLVGAGIAAPPPSGTPGSQVIQLAASGQDRANSLALSPDGRVLAVGSALGLYLFDVQAQREIQFIPTETWVRSVAFAPNGEWLATSSYDAEIKLWRAADGVLIRTLAGHAGWVRSIAFSSNGEVLASASDDNTVRLWRVSDGTLVRRWEAGVDGVRAVALSPDGAMLATGGFDNQVRLWRVSDGRLLKSLPGHTGWVRCLAFSPDGQWLASGAFDATARLWRVADGSLVHTLRDHTASVLGIAFSPDGEMLATGSVDTTVRIWQVATGKPQGLLRGHTDFVFGVVYSPDGQTLFSGATDNSVRVWSLEALSLTETLSGEGPDAPGSCTQCHHPRGSVLSAAPMLAPRVIEVSCIACHADGALGLNWDPTFARSGDTTTITSYLPPASALVGVPHGTPALSVEIATPGNGEHIYSGGDTAAYAAVAGRVIFSAGQPEKVEVRLEIWHGQQLAATATTQPGPDGAFSFAAGVNAGKSALAVPIDLRDCQTCHDPDYEGFAFGTDVEHALPAGEVLLRVTASALDGQVASDERWITVDRSGTAALTVQAVPEDGAAPLPAGLVVQAQTRLYEWRGRAFSGVTAAGGTAHLQVEALGQASTRYAFSLPPMVVDGVLYTSLAPAELTLPAGAVSAPPVTLVVRAQRGAVTGRLAGAPGLGAVPIWAVPLTGAAVAQTLTSHDGAFSFADLRIDDYLIMADAPTLAEAGLHSDGQRLDLSQTPQAEVVLSASGLDGLALHGTARDSAGRGLPFLWAAVDGASRGAAANPATGEWALWEAPEQARAVVVSAPGHYSQAQAVADDEPGAALDFRLTARPDTRYSAWGGGEIVLPAETVAAVEGRSIRLERGWLWGESPTADPVTIQTAGVSITLRGGRFAVENVPGQTAWLYVMAGEAEVERLDQPGPITPVPAGSMLALNLDGLAPVPIEPGLLAALRPAGPAPISAVWEPSLAARARDALARMGINTAQFITFVTYSTVLVALVSLPVLGVIWWGRYARRNRKPSP